MTETRPLPRCIAADFDFCLAHFGANFDGILDVFIQRGVPEPVAREAERAAEDRGFTFEIFIEEIKQRAGFLHRKLPREESIAAELQAWLATSLQLYPDVPAIIAHWMQQDIPLVIVTFGNATYQQAKITQTELPHTAAHFVSASQRKVDVIRSLRKQYPEGPIYYLEDKVAELDSVRDAGIPDICTVRVDRPDSPYANVHGAYAHALARDLREVDQMIALMRRARER